MTITAYLLVPRLRIVGTILFSTYTPFITALGQIQLLPLPIYFNISEISYA
jgi:hypothetical protein